MRKTNMEKTANQGNTQTDTKESLSHKAGYNQHTMPTKAKLRGFQTVRVCRQQARCPWVCKL